MTYLESQRISLIFHNAVYDPLGAQAEGSEAEGKTILTILILLKSQPLKRLAKVHMPLELFDQVTMK